MWTAIYILLGILGFVVLLLIIGTLLPHTYTVVRKIAIKAPADSIYPRLVRLKNWQEWIWWRKENFPEMEIEWEGPEEGVGAKQHWTDKSGVGRLWITDIEANKHVTYEMQFEKYPIMKASLQLLEAGDTTTVTWASEGKTPSGPFGGFFNLIMPKMIGRDYERGLEKLKEISEQS